MKRRVEIQGANNKLNNQFSSCIIIVQDPRSEVQRHSWNSPSLFIGPCSALSSSENRAQQYRLIRLCSSPFLTGGSHPVEQTPPHSQIVTITTEMSKDLENLFYVIILILFVAPENDSVRHGAIYI